MRHTENPVHPDYVPPVLEPAAAFAEYTRQYGRLAPEPDACAVATAIGRKLCAGRPGGTRLDGGELLAALEAPPRDDDISAAVHTILQGITVLQCMRLLCRCGTTPEGMARHVRAAPYQPPRLVAWLNQFTVRHESGTQGAD